VTRCGDVWGFVDLELDLWHVPDDDTPPGTDPRPRLSRHGRTAGIADDDELDDAVRSGWITPAEADRTRDEARYVADLILDAADPFTQAAWGRFDGQSPEDCRLLDNHISTPNREAPPVAVGSAHGVS
jgi:predicted RNA-binding protein associated with RNAse of E/G family